MTDTVDNVFNNRILDLVRNFGILSTYSLQLNSFKLQHDPFNMIYAVKRNKLHATVDAGQIQGDMRMYEIADMKHLEQLLYFVDEEPGEQGKVQRFSEAFTDQYFFDYLLSEHTKGNRDVNYEVIGEVEQLYRYAISMQRPPKEAVEALKDLTLFMNDDKPTNADLIYFKKGIKLPETIKER